MTLEVKSRSIERLRHPLRTVQNGVRRLLPPGLVANIRRSFPRVSNHEDLRLCYRAALRWIFSHTAKDRGVYVTNRRTNPYPEVTGYYIPTLLDFGESDLALQYARWLLKIQNRDGSWSGAEGGSAYTFDTGQILKGLVAILPVMPEAEPAIRRGCDWLLTQIEPSGRVVTPDKSGWCLPAGRTVPEKIHLYALQPLNDAGRRFNRQDYLDGVQRAVAYYLRQADLVEFDTLSHFHAYIIEALVDLGYPEVAKKSMNHIQLLQKKNGAVPGYSDVSWVCSTGLAQYAVIWYKLGELEPARDAFKYVCKLQNSSGGFYGSYGWGANYSPDEEISWAVKYFLDACNWHIQTSFDIDANEFPQTIGIADGRFKAISKWLGSLSTERVLDAGCGTGRFAGQLLNKFPNIDIWGIDISPEMLRQVPEPIKTAQGSLLRIPFPSGYFDRAFSIEALEHAINPATAVRELCRVVRPGGKIVIIDKNRGRQGMLATKAWESWFDESEVANWLAPFCSDIGSEFIGYEQVEEPDGLFIAWHGVRN